MIDRQNLFDQTVKTNLRTYDSIQKIAADSGDDYTTGCLLDYNYFKDYYKIIVIDLSKQQALEAHAKAIQQINFNGNLENNVTIFFIIEDVERIVSDPPPPPLQKNKQTNKQTVRVL